MNQAWPVRLIPLSRQLPCPSCGPHEHHLLRTGGCGGAVRQGGLLVPRRRRARCLDEPFGARVTR